ncbi:glutamyl-tRNA reductase [Microcella humidisoli]|uniref:Glutamyl-tRNA reductase n=1 Tax=Microcella humidisoli TaxID=2963406 RepID=A0ABY5FZJ1_9MICO|nr:glutamyl-tRNA reductase [Microcella humidisoli]UTT63547.1 glutamyl-tRNA reductase [Microcella humidisoli]
MLLCVTANHRNTPFEILERLSVDAGLLAETVAAGSEAVRGAVAVSTCNRVELYLDVDAPAISAHAVARQGFERALAALGGDEARGLTTSAEVLDDAAAVHHLFSVCAGLDSVAVGEEEIAGQVRRAAAHARATGTSSGRLDHVLQEAIRTARAARAQGDASRTGRSLARLALDLVGSRLTDWASTEVLLIGTGRYATTTAASLRERGAQRITVYSPTGRAQLFAKRQGVTATNDLSSALARAAVVITCTTRLSIGVDDVPAGTRALVVDLGLPRNVDPAVGALEGIALLDLETIRLHAPLVHWSAEEDARAVVDAAAHSYVTAASVEPAVVALREHVLGVVQAEIDRARARGDDGRVEEALRHLTSVLLHTPSTLARRHAAAGRGDQVLDAVRTLYGLEVVAMPAEGDAQTVARSSSASSAKP